MKQLPTVYANLNSNMTDAEADAEIAKAVDIAALMRIKADKQTFRTVTAFEDFVAEIEHNSDQVDFSGDCEAAHRTWYRMDGGLFLITYDETGTATEVSMPNDPGQFWFPPTS